MPALMAQDHCDETTRASDIQQPRLSAAPVLQCGCWRRQKLVLMKTTPSVVPPRPRSPLQMCRAEQASRCSEPTGQTGMERGSERSAHCWERDGRERRSPVGGPAGETTQLMMPRASHPFIASGVHKWSNYCLFKVQDFTSSFKT